MYFEEFTQRSSGEVFRWCWFEDSLVGLLLSFQIGVLFYDLGFSMVFLDSLFSDSALVLPPLLIGSSTVGIYCSRVLAFVAWESQMDRFELVWVTQYGFEVFRSDGPLGLFHVHFWWFFP